MRRILGLSLISALLLLSRQSIADPIKYPFQLQGAVVGECVYDLKADGSFSSKSTLAIGATKIDSELTGKFDKGELTEWSLKESASGRTGVVAFKDGKVSVELNGKQVMAPEAKEFARKAFFSPYHVGVFSTIAKAYHDGKNKTSVELVNPNAVATVSAGATFRSLAVKARPGGASAIPIEMITLNLGGLDIQFAFSIEGEALGIKIPAQMFTAMREGYEGVFVDPLSMYPELSQPVHKKVSTMPGLKMKTRDGVTLVADAVRPEEPGKYPVILSRTPYGRVENAILGTFWAQRGYVYVAQDVRGRGDSDGDFDPFNSEVKDGYDTLTWLTQQDWCDGNVGMIGGSYGGMVQWSAAVTKHPALKCIIPQVSPPDPTRNIPWDHGCFMLAPAMWWTNIVKDKRANMSLAMTPLSDLSVFNALPVSKVDDTMLKRNVPFFDEWLNRRTIDQWKGAYRQEQIGGVKIPTLHISGTWDGDGIGTKLHWEARRAAGSKNQWLVFGPWEHAFNTKSKFGDEDYGSSAVIDLDSVYLRFFDTYLKSKSVKQEAAPKVRFFVSGANRWITGPDWPLPFAKSRALYLSGGAATKGKTGALTSKLGKSAKDAYDYDPLAAKMKKEELEVDSSAAQLTIPKEAFQEGAAYRTDAFKKPTIITGPLRLELYVSTTAKDASFHAFVMDEAPNGTRRIIGQPGQMRVWFALGKPQAIVPNKIYKITIDPWEFAHQFAPGHRMAVGVTSNRFPQFARNPGTGESEATATKLIKATHTIHKGGKTPSRVTYYTFEP